MKYLVTGANGYVGQGIVKKLLDNGYQVIATDLSSEYIDKRAEIITTDLFDVENPYDFFKKPDVVLHLAWRGIYKHNSDIIMEDLPKHYKFLQNMVMSGTEQLSILGSMHEIGYWEGMINDSTPRNPSNLYGICKNALRQALEMLQTQYTFRLQWLVGFYTICTEKVYSKEGNVFLKISQAEENNQTTFPFVTGEHKFDFVDYDDFIDMIYETCIQKEINGQIYCCSGKPMKLKDRAEKFIKDNGFKIKLEYGAYPDRLNESNEIYGDSTKINLIRKHK